MSVAGEYSDGKSPVNGTAPAVQLHKEQKGKPRFCRGESGSSPSFQTRLHHGITQFHARGYGRPTSGNCPERYRVGFTIPISSSWRHSWSRSQFPGSVEDPKEIPVVRMYEPAMETEVAIEVVTLSCDSEEDDGGETVTPEVSSDDAVLGAKARMA
ncbi:GM10403 [Drosophila sechellia]|uniref:GM10403 n=1 Tax=Drosophila sechellia TaxID=7238 RepID=B4ILH5_DROSE|nr:GM10403 [Drosophila sechellia]